MAKCEAERFYTSDWFTHNLPMWEQLLEHFKGRPNLRFLEVGSYQGRATIWLLENVLTHSSSRITCVDTFEGSVEHTGLQRAHIRDIFHHNTHEFHDRIDVRPGKSQRVLRGMMEEGVYDFIYIDADHRAASVLEDAVLAFPLLKPGGIMVFDDYMWEVNKLRELDRPMPAINAFISLYADHLNVVAMNYQVAIQKVFEVRQKETCGGGGAVVK